MDRKLIQQCLCCTQSQLRQPLELLFILKSSPSDSFLCCYYYGKFCTQKSTLTSMYQEPSPPPISHTHGHVAASTSPSSSPIVHYYGPNPRRHLIPPINMSACRSKSQGLCFPSMTHNTPSHLTEETNCCGDPLGRLTAATCTACLPFPTRMDLICFLPRPRPSGRTGCLAAPRTHRPPRALVLAVTPARCSSPRGTQSPFPCPLSLAQRDLL